jgi:hypothetical protein
MKAGKPESLAVRLSGTGTPVREQDNIWSGSNTMPEVMPGPGPAVSPPALGLQLGCKLDQDLDFKLDRTGGPGASAMAARRQGAVRNMFKQVPVSGLTQCLRGMLILVSATIMVARLGT